VRTAGRPTLRTGWRRTIADMARRGGTRRASEPADSARRARRDREGEHRWPAAAAVLVAAALYAALPGSLLFAPRLLIPGLELALLVALVVHNPRRLTRETRWSRIVSLALAALVTLTNLAALGLLVRHLVTSSPGGAQLLLAAFQVWTTNVIAFALLYWELDRGGPVARVSLPRERLPLADFRFTQDETAGTVVEVAAGFSQKADWIPLFVDYLYLSTTNSSAFSPTDTMPLSPRAKVLMGIQATAALLTSLLVIARAVSALGS
jgi:hypothetical protein